MGRIGRNLRFTPIGGNIFGEPENPPHPPQGFGSPTLNLRPGQWYRWMVAANEPQPPLLLYIVPWSDDVSLDRETEAVAAVFVCRGFEVVVHSAPHTATSVVEGAQRSQAETVLLGAGLSPSVLREMTRALRKTVDYVFAVGRSDAEEREGDQGEPFGTTPMRASAWEPVRTLREPRGNLASIHA